MPEHLKALAVILTLASVVFAFARQPACALAMASQDFARRRNLWFAVTLIAFLAHNFWIYVLLVGLLLLLAGQHDRNRIALFYFLLIAVPPIGSEIAGVGGIRAFFTIDYLRLLSLTLLLPAAMLERMRALGEGRRMSAADKLLAAYIALSLVLQLNVDTFTNTMRSGFYFFMDLVLPYYVASRSLRNIESFRDALMGLTLGTMVLAAVAVFEFSRKWLLYSALENALGVNWGYSPYLIRDENLRALGSTGQPIVLGYVMAIAVGMFLFLWRSVPSRTSWLFGLFLLLAGLVSSLSRGPWIGAAVVVVIFIATGPKPVSRLLWLGILGIIVMSALLVTPLGAKIISYLPFVGSVHEETITYRQLLLEVATYIILDNPLFGSYDFLLYMQELRQGDGIIDLVNSYVAIALSSGLVGLGLFVCFFGVILFGIFSRMHTLDKGDELHLLGRALIATISGILVTIFTVSSINVIPVLYWSIAGLGLAFSLLPVAENVASQSYRIDSEPGVRGRPSLRPPRPPGAIPIGGGVRSQCMNRRRTMHD